jgi:hypothetical protein
MTYDTPDYITLLFLPFRISNTSMLIIVGVPHPRMNAAVQFQDHVITYKLSDVSIYN